MSKHAITAIYDTREYANNAVLMLRQAGIPDADVSVSPETGTADGVEPRAKGFWASLEDMFGGSDDHHTYAEGVRRGGTLVVARVEDARMDEAIDILERHGSVDLEERETAWRGEGWTGASAVTGGGVANEGAGPLRSMAPVASTETKLASDGVLTTPSAQQAYRTEQVPVGGKAEKPSLREDVIQVAEESIAVGKRAVNRGKVRIHSHVVETPFMQQVNLRDETVSVERRPVDRALGVVDLGADPFRERTIEMDEVDEEAVVAKTVRVVEEIGIRKDVSDRAETVTDTLRSTKVDIEDGRTAGHVAGQRVAFFADAPAMERAKDMKVIGSDGQHVGVVDHVDGTTIKLKRTDPVSGGSHHLIPTEWVQSVDSTVTLKVTAAVAMSRWTAV
ncbi:DUF2171 domain-containing protein [Lichenihabitans sp. Uapishka_5]|uniref:DUF2171 domain-containing protein n=1 Tax=Lichenihabitans sp. Uapishka_5 TaxID=3037302 RepID=UPI0029E7E069|nr:DUF2171 domain-containing protein [Lichenihabitans sp. Uapishka_5]MDX7951366.1 DUF2171 domain-containing protein [Lichenihabitans sp. Uapishka_5]